LLHGCSAAEQQNFFHNKCSISFEEIQEKICMTFQNFVTVLWMFRLGYSGAFSMKI